MVSPTQLSLRQLRREGYEADVCERWLPHTDPPLRHDLFHAFDVVAVKACEIGVLGVQTTSASCHSTRVRKLAGIPALQTWLSAGNRAEVWSWSKNDAGK